MNFTSVPKNVRDLLSSGFYRIPRFQRPYSWEREQLEEFWNDAVVNDEPEYFIGSIVTYGEGNGIRGVVDGQQRLTTLTLLFCCLRNAFAKEGYQQLADGLHGMTIERQNVGGLPEYILQPETSYPYFQEHIQKKTAPEIAATAGAEEKSLLEAFLYLCSQLASTITAIRTDESLSAAKRKAQLRKKLESIRDKLLALSLISVGVDKEDDAYLLFETLNARGKDLRVSDLVKNHLTRLLKKKTKTVDTVRDRWNKIISTIEASGEKIDVDDLIHHHWLSSHEYTSEKKLFKAIKKAILKANAGGYLDQLVAECPLYRSIFEPLTASWGKTESAIGESLYGLTVFGVRQPAPLLLALLSQLKAGILKPKHVSAALRAVEAFHFQVTAIASQSSSGGISQMYAKHARQVREATNSQEANHSLNELKTKLRARLPKPGEFDAQFSKLSYSAALTRDRRLVNYVLGRITRRMLDLETLDYRKMTIEHIEAQSAGILDDDHVASIGNLLLVGDKLNGKLGAKPFSQKKSLLKKANGVWKDQELDAAISWSNAEIERRTALLAKVAREKVWKA